MPHYSPLEWVHLILALIIASAYLAIPFTALRRLSQYLPMKARVGGTLFFITCALTHLAIAGHVHENKWMILNDLVQAVAVITFITSLSMMVGKVMDKRAARIAARTGSTNADDTGVHAT